MLWSFGDTSIWWRNDGAYHVIQLVLIPCDVGFIVWCKYWLASLCCIIIILCWRPSGAGVTSWHGYLILSSGDIDIWCDTALIDTQMMTFGDTHMMRVIWLHCYLMIVSPIERVTWWHVCMMYIVLQWLCHQFLLTLTICSSSSSYHLSHFRL